MEIKLTGASEDGSGICEDVTSAPCNSLTLNAKLQQSITVGRCRRILSLVTDFASVFIPCALLRDCSLLCIVVRAGALSTNQPLLLADFLAHVGDVYVHDS